MSGNRLSQLFSALKMANYRRLRKRREPQRLAYQQWVLEHDTIDEQRRQELSAQSRQLAHRPLISVVMPVYNAPLVWLDAAIESVRRQIYQEWELCIADDCSTHPEIRPYLIKKSQEDARIKVEFRKENGHISAASNSAIAISSGDFIALMDQDDLIPANALLEVALCANEHPNAKIIYTDEDKIDENDQREAPARKPSWDKKLVLELNRVSHLTVYKSDIVRSAGGFRLGYEGAQDHDLILRCSELVSGKDILHIPKILYHWRIHADSTAHMSSAKPYAIAARKRALKDYHARKIAQHS